MVGRDTVIKIVRNEWLSLHHHLASEARLQRVQQWLVVICCIFLFAGTIGFMHTQGGREAGQRFIERLELVSHLANVGDAKTLVIHPASTTHHRMDAAALQAAGISEGLVRISVGIEDIDDLMEDIGLGLRASQKA